MTTKYDVIGDNYNQTRKADPYLTSRIIHHLKPIEGGRYLDIGCGTGNYTCALFNAGISVTGIDPSEKMLAEASSKSSDIHWICGRVEAIGIEPNTFNGALAILTIHHWTDLAEGFRELYTVLKKESRLVIFTSTPLQMQGYWLNYYFPEMMKRSCLQMPTLALVEEALLTAGFRLIEKEKYEIRDDLKDMFMYIGKNKPERYLDSTIRNGISTFSDLAEVDEMEKGLEQLTNDITSGKIDKIIRSYRNITGDYLFIKAEKN